MILDKFSLDEKVALVTGAGRGIGQVIARCFAEAGATVICAARTQVELDATVAQIQSSGGQALAYRCDVTDSENIEQMIATAIEQYGGIDILVNNAGGGGHRPTHRLDDEFMIDALKLNLFAGIHCTRLASETLKQRRGNVINISSGMSSVAESNCVTYAAAKAGLEQATRNLAHELAPEVRVNALRLGAIETPDFQRLVEMQPGIDTELAQWTPVQRLGLPEDVALACIYLASPAGSFTTGQVIDVDGGILLQRGIMAIIQGHRQ